MKKRTPPPPKFEVREEPIDFDAVLDTILRAGPVKRKKPRKRPAKPRR